jgi:hypothetical protein
MRTETMDSDSDEELNDEEDDDAEDISDFELRSYF